MQNATERETVLNVIRERWRTRIAAVKNDSSACFTVRNLYPAEPTVVSTQVRRWVEGRVYGSIEEKVAAVNACLSRLESDPERVKSLVGWEWIKRNVQGLPEHYAASSS